MAIIVTYDVTDKHIPLKKALFELGYQDKIRHDNDYIYLPNTVVYHASKTATQGREDVKSVCKSLNVQLERCVVTQWGPEWAAEWGKPFGT